MTTLALDERPVGILVFDRVMIEDLSRIRPGPDLATALSLRPNRVSFLHPVRDVEVVDVLLDDVVAAQPVEVVPVAHLVLHFGLSRLPLSHPHALAVPVHSARIRCPRSFPS